MGLSELERDRLIKRYINRLIQEIEDRSVDLSGDNIDTVYIGGGTPSLLACEDVYRILQTVRENYNLDNNGVEITIECNPEDFSFKKIVKYRHIGINRVVLGVQTLNEHFHSIIGRSSGVCDDKTLSGFIDIDDIIHGIDLITGIPGQTVEGLSLELEKICRLKPEHISVYSLTIEKGTNIYNRLKFSSSLEDQQRTMLEVVVHKLKGSGYDHYEVSNFALPSFSSRHNLKYWKFLSYIGFGVGAHSFYHNERFYNTLSIDEYINCDKLILMKDERIDNSRIVEYIFSGMRLLQGISLRDFESKLHLSMPEEIMNRLRGIAERGYIIIEEYKDDTSVRFTLEGLFIMDSLTYEVLEPVL